MNTVVILLCLGLVAGTLSGMVGIGGGIIIVPALVYFLGFSQHQAQGTTLAILMMPIGVLGVYNYYQAGTVDIKSALIIAFTFIIGSYLGSKISLSLDQTTVKKFFGGLLLIISIKMLIGK